MASRFTRTAGLVLLTSGAVNLTISGVEYTALKREYLQEEAQRHRGGREYRLEEPFSQNTSWDNMDKGANEYVMGKKTIPALEDLVAVGMIISGAALASGSNKKEE